MLKITRSRDRLVFIMGIPILVRHLYIETAPLSMVFLVKAKKIQFERFHTFEERKQWFQVERRHVQISMYTQLQWHRHYFRYFDKRKFGLLKRNLVTLNYQQLQEYAWIEEINWTGDKPSEIVDSDWEKSNIVVTMKIVEQNLNWTEQSILSSSDRLAYFVACVNGKDGNNVWDRGKVLNLNEQASSVCAYKILSIMTMEWQHDWQNSVQSDGEVFGQKLEYRAVTFSETGSLDALKPILPVFSCDAKIDIQINHYDMSARLIKTLLPSITVDIAKLPSTLINYHELLV